MLNRTVPIAAAGLSPTQAANYRGHSMPNSATVAVFNTTGFQLPNTGCVDGSREKAPGSVMPIKASSACGGASSSLGGIEEISRAGTLLANSEQACAVNKRDSVESATGYVHQHSSAVDKRGSVQSATDFSHPHSSGTGGAVVTRQKSISSSPEPPPLLRISNNVGLVQSSSDFLSNYSPTKTIALEVVGAVAAAVRPSESIPCHDSASIECGSDLGAQITSATATKRGTLENEIENKFQSEYSSRPVAAEIRFETSSKARDGQIVVESPEPNPNFSDSTCTPSQPSITEVNDRISELEGLVGTDCTFRNTAEATKSLGVHEVEEEDAEVLAKISEAQPPSNLNVEVLQSIATSSSLSDSDNTLKSPQKCGGRGRVLASGVASNNLHQHETSASAELPVESRSV